MPYSKILVALDGSHWSAFGGRLTLRLAAAARANVTACHVYGALMHERRFRDMEPTLPRRYRQADGLAKLRQSHGSLIEEGFRALSAGYIDAFRREAQQAGTLVETVAVEGRNYVAILELADRIAADLLVVGAQGLGAADGEPMGSTAARALRHARCDVLVARPPADHRPRDGAEHNDENAAPIGGCVVAGIDGSRHALRALDRAAQVARALGAPLCLAAAYDPQFHAAVFRAMAESLSPCRQAEVGLAKQEGLHDELINDSLGKLYEGLLDEARSRLGDRDVAVETALLRGKAHRAVCDFAAERNAGLIVVGRWGHHRQEISLIGSNAEALARRGPASVLVTRGTDRSAQETAAAGPPGPQGAGEAPLAWDDDAQARLNRVPGFVRAMARRAVEEAVRAAGRDRVALDDFLSVAKRFGMGRGASAAEGGDD